MKKILLLLLFYSHIFALSIDESLLNIHATLLPKLALMDSNYKEKLNEGSLSIVVFYSRMNHASAKLLRKNILTKYANGIKNHPIKVTLLSYHHLRHTKGNIYYLMPADTKKIKEVLILAQKEKILTFSYLKDDLAQGSMIALSIGAKVKPILNLTAVKECKVSIRDVLLKISTIYNNEEVN